jgi:two-component system sensor histidine kinase AlgZ
MITGASGQPSTPFYLPDFCTSRAALGVVLIVELTALILTLAHDSNTLSFWSDLARMSFFLLWIGLAGAGLLCGARDRLKKMSVAKGSSAVLALIVGLVVIVSEVTLLAGQSEFIENAGATALFPTHHWSFLGRNVGISFIVTALALRYFYVTHEWRRNVEMEAKARVHALQARIRPHFLFNSMNTIASLTRSDPARAELAVQDLADLFRANLSEKRQTITLEQEIEVAQIYQRIEQVRLGDRLRVEWNIRELPKTALVPGLLLQPILENAIYHGIEPRPEGGVVTVTGELSGGLITIVVRNPAQQRDSEREGNRLAIANIRERLALLYGERALIKAGRFDAEYIVTLRFPHVESLAKLSA